MEHQYAPSRFPDQDLRALIMNPLLLDDQWPAFAGRTPSSAWHKTMQHRSESLLERVAKDPSPLIQWIGQQPSHRLGSYFEQLFAFWLSHLDNITSVHRQTRIIQEGRTLGELDILYYDQAIGEALHFELAIKFYLQTTRGSVEPRDFIGPRAQDRLDIKLDRLFQKQLRHLETAAGLQALPRELQNMPVTSRAFVQGGLFHPIDVWFGSEMPSPPKGLARTAPLGWWVPASVRPPDTWPFLRAEKWTILSKLEWMSRQSRSRQDPELEDATSFWQRSQREIEERCRALLVVGFACDEVHGGWQEVTRGFLVPENWPQA